ncbi:MAG: pilus assembly protein TadG-related protein [Candidatus Omnitrophota bacterium]|nr:pilus assembly protein TadG-related protein [Candidatus Omnitrophota bacterium]
MKLNEKGYVFVSAGAALLVFLSFSALVTDLGHIYVTKSQLQNTADAAALASVMGIPQGTEVARDKALDFGQSHYVAGSQILIEDSGVVLGHYDYLTSTFYAGESPINSTWVMARRDENSPSGALPLFFGQILGQGYSNVRAVARAALDNHIVGVKGKNRLIPYSVINFVVDQDLDGEYDLGSVIDIHPRDDAPGNFGFLDLDYGSNDVPELRQYIEEGYDSDFTIPPGGSVPVPGSPGITGNSLLNSFHIILNEIVFLPVHQSVVYEGDNAIFNVISILGVRIRDVKLNGNPAARYIKAEIVYYASSVLVTDPNAPPNNSLAKPRLVA